MLLRCFKQPIVFQSFLNFILPFRWRFTYVPVLSVKALDLLDAPGTFIMGCHSQHLNEAKQVPVIIYRISMGLNRLYCINQTIAAHSCSTRRSTRQMQWDNWMAKNILWRDNTKYPLALPLELSHLVTILHSIGQKWSNHILLYE